MRAGNLRNRITLQTRVTGEDSLGQESQSWNDLATVWSQVTTKRGREFFAAGAVQSEAAAVFRIRYRRDIELNSNIRVRYRGIVYDVIEPPQDVDGRGQMMDLMCSTGMRDGR